MSKHYDIIIAGGGLVGASLARALHDQPLRIAVVEAVPIKAENQPSYDSKGLALSLASTQIFEHLGIWPRLTAEACPIRHIHVSDRGHFGFVRLSASDLGIDALGQVVKAHSLGLALLESIETAMNIDYLCPAQITDVRASYEQAEVTLDKDGSEEVITTSLLVVADGTHSSLRRLLGIPTMTKDYQQTAIVTNVLPERPHQNTAFERFTEHGPIALLPLSSGRCSLVYTVPTAEAEQLLELETNRFLEMLWTRFGRRLGRFSEAGPMNLYPLKLIESEQQVLNRVVLLGNSAHTIHPNGAQGFNLCLRDVAALSEHLAGAVREQEDIGNLKLLERYASSRLQDQQRVTQFSDRLAEWFYNRNPVKAVLRNTGMLVTDLVPSIKRNFMRQAMGISGRQPAAVRGIQASLK